MALKLGEGIKTLLIGLAVLTPLALTLSPFVAFHLYQDHQKKLREAKVLAVSIVPEADRLAYRSWLRSRIPEVLRPIEGGLIVKATQADAVGDEIEISFLQVFIPAGSAFAVDCNLPLRVEAAFAVEDNIPVQVDLVDTSSPESLLSAPKSSVPAGSVAEKNLSTETCDELAEAIAASGMVRKSNQIDLMQPLGMRTERQ